MNDQPLFEADSVAGSSSMTSAAAPPDSLHSRARLAGYDPDVLAAGRVTVVGCGALGQNLALNLALSGVGNLFLVDFDDFEAHNATRSPFYPNPAEAEAYGPAKARVVARKVRSLMTAEDPHVGYRCAPVQELGDAPLRWAHVVCAAVDNPRARAWLAERCRLNGIPLVEAGFDGPALNLGVFGIGAEQACYRCLNPALDGAFSCAAYAAASEALQAIPAVQSGAATLAGLQAEQAILRLGGAAPLEDRRLYLDLRSGEAHRVEVKRSAGCPGIHVSTATLSRLDVPIRGDDSTVDVIDTLGTLLGADTALRLPDAIVGRAACALCGALCEVSAPEWRWLSRPRCAACGGPWPTSCDSRDVPAGADWLDRHATPWLGSATFAELGAPTGTTLLVEAPDAALRWTVVV